MDPPVRPEKMNALVELAANVAHVLLVAVADHVVDELALELAALAAVLAGEAILVGVHAVVVKINGGLQRRVVAALIALVAVRLLELVRALVDAQGVLALEALVALVALEGTYL